MGKGSEISNTFCKTRAKCFIHIVLTPMYNNLKSITSKITKSKRAPRPLSLRREFEPCFIFLHSKTTVMTHQRLFSSLLFPQGKLGKELSLNQRHPGTLSNKNKNRLAPISPELYTVARITIDAIYFRGRNPKLDRGEEVEKTNFLLRAARICDVIGPAPRRPAVL